MIKSKPRKKVSKRSNPCPPWVCGFNPSTKKTRFRNPNSEKRQKVKDLTDEIRFFLTIIESQDNPNIAELIRFRDLLDDITYLDRYPNFNSSK